MDSICRSFIFYFCLWWILSFFLCNCSSYKYIYNFESIFISDCNANSNEISSEFTSENLKYRWIRMFYALKIITFLLSSISPLTSSMTHFDEFEVFQYKFISLAFKRWSILHFFIMFSSFIFFIPRASASKQ
jgi:hypothetical protein